MSRSRKGRTARAIVRNAQRKARPTPSRGGERPSPPRAPGRVRCPPLPTEPRAPPPGSWVWTCRPGFEALLFEELAWAGAHVELSTAALLYTDRPVAAPAFARMAFRVVEVVHGTGDETLDRFARALMAAAGVRPFLLQAWTPDSEAANRFAPLADELAEALRTRLATAPIRWGATAEEVRAHDGMLGQLCVVSPELLIAGVVPSRQALSLAPGGRQRMRRPGDAPSRAAMKLEEALDALPIAPGRGEVCVDLGAAPGGWTARLVARGARVIAVDPANLAPELAAHPRVRHVKESAFAFAPEEPVDWLLCDMAWRPLEVAQLLAKWGRRQWATHLVANLKLPMKDKNPILFRARALLEEAGWKRVTMRQLYHDRDEVTVTAQRG